MDIELKFIGKGELMEKTFKVTGMHCTSCEILIKDALNDLKAPGLKVMEVSSKKGIVRVTFDEKKIAESKIKAVIEAEGYTVAK